MATQQIYPILDAFILSDRPQPGKVNRVGTCGRDTPMVDLVNSGRQNKANTNRRVKFVLSNQRDNNLTDKEYVQETLT